MWTGNIIEIPWRIFTIHGKPEEKKGRKNLMNYLETNLFINISEKKNMNTP